MNHSRFRLLLLLLPLGLLGLLNSCSHKPGTAIPAFYYWKTTYELNNTEKQLLDSTNAKLLYVRFFDLGESYDDKYFPVVPEGKIEFKQPLPANIRVIPVVFITNEALAKLDSNRVNELATKMRRKIDRMCEKNRIAKPLEYQLDCDWTKTSKDKYFKLVEAFKQQVSPSKVSVTIRLHQYKYAAKTGVPPADRGLLMFYNMGQIKNEDEENYVLNIEEAKKYLTEGKQYALPLDIGLPVYSQGVCYDSIDGKAYGIMSPEDVEKDIANGWLTPTSGNWFKSTEGKPDTYKSYYNNNVKVRYEQVTPDKLMQASELLRPLVPSYTFRVVFFHLDSFQCRNFNAHDFDKVVNHF